MNESGNKPSHKMKQKLFRNSLGILKRKLHRGKRRRGGLRLSVELSPASTAQAIHPSDAFRSITVDVTPKVRVSGSSSELARKVDYTVERTAYLKVKESLISEYPGRFVVFVGDEKIGPFENLSSAVREARRLYGRRPIYTKRLVADDSSR